MNELLANPAVLVVLAASAPVSAVVAVRRFRHPGVWLVFGAILGPVAIVLLAVAPAGRCPYCEAPTRGWPTICDACGRTLRGHEGEPDVRPEPSPPAEPQRRDALPGAPTPNEAAPDRGPRYASKVSATALGTRVTGPDQRPLAATTARPPRARSIDGAPAPARTLPAAGSTPTAADAPAAAAASASVATGVFLGGNAGLELGTRYLVAQDSEHLRVLGPVDLSPGTIVLEAAAADADVTVAGDRLVIAIAHKGTLKTLVFRSVAGWAPGPIHLDVPPSSSSPVH